MRQSYRNCSPSTPLDRWIATPRTDQERDFATDGEIAANPNKPSRKNVHEWVLGVDAEFANVVNVWTLDTGTLKWTQVTNLKADFDHWAISMSPVFDDTSGSLPFVVESGLGSGGIEDVTIELWMWVPGSGALSMLEAGADAAPVPAD